MIMTSKSIDFPSHKTCDNCHMLKEITEFLKNNKALVWCQSYIDEFVYNSLISLENTNNFYENDNVELVISFDVELSSLITTILDKNKENFNNNEKLYLEVACHIAKFIENRDETTLEICEFIRNNINYLVPELHRQIKEKQLKGYENLTEIIIDITTSTPALGFLTVLFYQLPRNNFDAIQIDTTYGTNKMRWELYAIMGVIDETGFPISYLLIAAGKSRDITTILIQWISELKNRQLVIFLSFRWIKTSAIKQRVALNQPISNYLYDPIVVYQECSAIDPC
ncbi:9791_t:CDS:2 [Cetraspora pellucida]|uniref:9791_t:CDS:1 n=1 Tax=Cetraspora pellucida TaxID=1433469 RepID=A0A9N9PD01_9GLOM|nr:9791_t:CDS:2 [Cetraspora pellucida]